MLVEHGRASHFTPQVWLGIIASANGRLELRFEDSAAASTCSLWPGTSAGWPDVSLAQRKEGLGRLLIQQLADSASYSREQGRNRIDMSFLQTKDREHKPTF